MRLHKEWGTDATEREFLGYVRASCDDKNAVLDALRVRSVFASRGSRSRLMTSSWPSSERPLRLRNCSPRLEHPERLWNTHRSCEKALFVRIRTKRKGFGLRRA